MADFIVANFSGCGFFAKRKICSKIVELYSAFLNSRNPPELNYEKASKNCFDFVRESEVECAEKRWDLVYGTHRAGDDWNWFEISSSKNVRSKIINLGKLDWTDSFEAPLIEPYPKLKEGESGVMTFDTSGKNGRKGNSKIANASEKETEKGQIAESKVKKSETKTSGGFTKVILENMYAARIVDDNVDFYVLFRIDALEGDKCTISWKKVDASKEK